jgi:uncharacterized HAD superfamily protein
MRIGLDFDGVLCLTPFGRLAVHAPKPVPPLPADYERLYAAPPPASPLRLAVEYARFAWRASAPNAGEVLRELSARHELYIVTGRSGAGLPLVRRWLRRRGIEGCVKDVRMAPRGLRPSQHKLATAKVLGIDVHIDDDPRTAYHLARNGVQRVYLLDHAGAHGDAPLPERLTLVRSLREFADSVNAS